MAVVRPACNGRRGTSGLEVSKLLCASSLALSTICCLRQIWHRSRRRRGEPPLVLGWFPFIGAAPAYFAEPLEFLRRTRESLGDAFTVRMAGNSWTFVFSQPDSAEFESLPERKASLQMGFFHIAKVFLPDFSDQTGIFSMTAHTGGTNGNLLITPALKQIPQWVCHVREVVERHVFASVPEESIVDVFPFCSDMIIGITLRCLVGPEIFAEGFEGFKVWRDIFRHMDPEQAFVRGSGGRMAIARSVLEYVLTGERQAYKRFYSKLGPIVDRHLQAAANGQLEGTEVVVSYIKWWLDKVGGDPSKVHRKRIMRDVFFFSMAAIANSFGNAAWVIIYNLRDADLRRRQQQEFDDVFGAGDAFTGFTLEGLERCSVLQATMLEVARLYTPGSSFRLVMEDLHLSSGTVVPAGHLLCTNNFFNWRDPAYFQDPDHFNIDRHLPGRDEAAKRAHAEGRFAPFGKGAHVCLGRRFANMEVALFVALLFQTFEAALVDPSGHVHLDPQQSGFIWRPTHPVHMKLKRRN